MPINGLTNEPILCRPGKRDGPIRQVSLSINDRLGGGAIAGLHVFAHQPREREKHGWREQHKQGPGWTDWAGLAGPKRTFALTRDLNGAKQLESSRRTLKIGKIRQPRRSPLQF